LRKYLQLVSLVATVAVVVAGTGTALAHKNGKGKGHKGSHGAFIMNAKLVPVTGATGATGATGSTGSTGATGVTGKVRVVQNRKWVIFSGHLRGLTPAAVYTVGLHADVDGQGCASTTNAVLNPPTFKNAKGNSGGNGNTKARVLVKKFALDPTADYYVAAYNATGGAVACGDLVLKKKPKKHDDKGKGHIK